MQSLDKVVMTWIFPCISSTMNRGLLIDSWVVNSIMHLPLPTIIHVLFFLKFTYMCLLLLTCLLFLKFTYLSLLSLMYQLFLRCAFPYLLLLIYLLSYLYIIMCYLPQLPYLLYLHHLPQSSHLPHLPKLPRHPSPNHLSPTIHTRHS